MRKLVSIVELATFIRAADGVLNDEEKDELKFFLAANPEAGDVIVGTGGARKLRWTAQGKGKRGGGRVIYYFYNETAPLFLMDFYVKGARQSLTAGEKKEFRAIIDLLVGAYR